MESVSDYIKQLMKGQNFKGNNFNEGFKMIIGEIKKDPEIKRFLKEHQSDLADNAVERSAAKLYEYVNVKHQVAENKRSFAPGYLPQLVVNDHLIDVSYAASPRVIAKQKAEALSRRVTTISMPKDIRDATIDQVDTPDDNPSRLNIVNLALDFMNNLAAHKQEFFPGLYIYGPLGVGKTFLIGAIANELAKRDIQTTLVHFPSLAVEMKSAINTNSVNDKIDVIKKSPVLMIDDIGADAMSSWIRDEVLGVILEYRMQQQLPTFFTSNFSMAQLEQEHLRINNRGDDEPLKAKRIMERVRFLSREVEMTGENRRPK